MTNLDLIVQAEKLRSQGQLEKSVDILADVLTITPDDTKLRAKFARRLHELGRLEQALREFDILIDNEPHIAEHQTAKGVILGFLGRTEDALAVSMEAAKKDPTAWLNVCRMQQNLGDIPASIKALETCIEKQPDNILARNSLNMLLFNTGLKEEA